MADYREQSTDAAVKASGAAALTADQAMVVALSPNSNAVSVISQPELVVTGTITTTDIVVAAPTGTGILLSGTSTAGSYVAALATGGNASVVIGITGLTSGTIYYEGSADSTTGVDGNWISLNMKQAGITNTQISSSVTASGLYRGNTAGIRYIRMRSVGALTGTPTITLRLSAGVAGEFLFGSIPSGTNTIGAVTFGTPAAFTLSSAATTNATSVKATAGTVFQIVASNVGAAVAFLKVFNLATAPTVGTSVPVLTISLPASGVVQIPFGALGMRFSAGIAFDITNLVADTDASVISAAQVKVMISYL